MARAGAGSLCGTANGIPDTPAGTRHGNGGGNAQGNGGTNCGPLLGGAAGLCFRSFMISEAVGARGAAA